jgi:hypothetical protein
MKSKIIMLLFSLAFFLMVDFVSAQPLPPGSHGSTGNEGPSGGGAPIAGGVGILIVLGAGYGIKKWYSTKKEE